jgi:hypothetical protein
MSAVNQIGYCPTCTNPDCSAPRVMHTPQRDCPKGQAWTDGNPIKIRQRDIIQVDHKKDFFKGIPDGSTVTRRLDQCPKCTGHMPGLTCNDCGYQFELERV